MCDTYYCMNEKVSTHTHGRLYIRKLNDIKNTEAYKPMLSELQRRIYTVTIQY